VNAANTSIIYCHCAFGTVIPQDKKQAVFDALAGSGKAFHAAADLCQMAALRDPALKDFLTSDEVVFVACYPRAVKGLILAAGLGLVGKRVRYFNLLEQSVDEIKAGLFDGQPGAPVQGTAPPEPEGDWIPWFPVIDYDRCKQCKQCLSFCLFGVYELASDGHVEVRNPRNCKTNCPACARICPEVAIQFPKFTEAPINGAPILDETCERAKVKVNLDQMLGADVYAALAERRKKAKMRRLVAIQPAYMADDGPGQKPTP
jgi:NAD-dependent dihydropyrimidine dehydrogenase PreA subunit